MYFAEARLETMPSARSLQALWKMVGPSDSRCSERRRVCGSAWARISARRALRSRSGRLRVLWPLRWRRSKQK